MPEPTTQAAERPCRCLQSHANITPTHSGHCCFVPASQTCHPAEVAAWARRRDASRAERAALLGEGGQHTGEDDD